MIEFQLDETSGVATYLQLVQQVVAQLAPFGASGGPGPDDIEAIYRTAFRDCFAEGVA